MKLNNIPLELDNRIFDIADIKTVITADENDVGKMGYFANSIHLFKNLEGQDGIKYGKLIYLSDLDYGGDKSDKCFVCSTQWAYRYFIPEDALKPEEPEKKYRPYTKHEFLNKFECGKPVNIRRKDDYINFFIETIPSVKIDNLSDDVHVRLFEGIFNLKRLFDEFEWQKSNGEWQPFGVIDD